jgi:hypothetical protein
VASHPLRAVWQTRDVRTIAAALADDVVLHSPIVRKPFEGREEAVELFEVLLERLGEFEITDQLEAGDTHAFFWRADAAGRWIEGADLVRHDADGRIKEVQVLIRPLLGIAAFAAAVGPALASRRGRLNAIAVRLMVGPLRAFLTVADILSSRLVQRR